MKLQPIPFIYRHYNNPNYFCTVVSLGNASAAFYNSFVNGKELVKLLEKNGWKLKRISGSHHIFEKDGEKKSISVPVHGKKNLGKGLLHDLLKKGGIKQ